MNKTIKTFGIIAAAAALSGIVSCVKENKTEPESGSAASIEFANPADQEIFINEGHTETVKIDLNLNKLTKNDLIIEAKSNPDNWCDARISSKEDAILVTPGANETENDLVAEFVVKSVKDEVLPLTFKVTSVGSATEKYFRVTAEPKLTKDEYGTITFNPSPVGETLVLKIETNLEKWYFGDYNMVTDDEYNPIEWYTVDKRSGRNGESLTITFSANGTTDDRKTSIFLDETEGSMSSMYFSVMVTQGARPATSVSVSVYNANYELMPVEDTTYDVSFGKDDKGSDFSLNFEMEKDGSVELVFCKSGSTEKDPSIEGADNPWVMYSAMDGYSIMPTANDTGKERKADLVIFSAGSTTELFRFKITQKGELKAEE